MWFTLVGPTDRQAEVWFCLNKTSLHIIRTEQMVQHKSYSLRRLYAGTLVVLQIAVKNNLNVKVVLQVATACESHIYSPIKLWKNVCLETATSLYFWPLSWKTPKQRLYIKSRSVIIGELWADSSLGISLHTCHAFNYEPLMSWWKTVNNHTARSLRKNGFKVHLGMTFFHEG